jgi:hypothetical protein
MCNNENCKIENCACICNPCRCTEYPCPQEMYAHEPITELSLEEIQGILSIETNSM